MPEMRRLANVALVISMVLIGCGKSKGPPTAVVSGKVSLDGAPLEKGVINFVPTDGKGTTEGGKIVKGAYSVTVGLGDKRVEIRSPKVVGQRDAYPGDPNSPKMDITEEVVPSRYNSRSELKVPVTGRKAEDFKLKTPKDQSN